MVHTRSHTRLLHAREQWYEQGRQNIENISNNSIENTINNTERNCTQLINTISTCINSINIHIGNESGVESVMHQIGNDLIRSLQLLIHYYTILQNNLEASGYTPGTQNNQRAIMLSNRGQRVLLQLLSVYNRGNNALEALRTEMLQR